MTDDKLSSDIQNQKRVHVERISVLEKQKNEINNELTKRKAIVKSMDKQLDKLNGVTRPKKVKGKKVKAKSDSAKTDESSGSSTSSSSKEDSSKINTNELISPDGPRLEQH